MEYENMKKTYRRKYCDRKCLCIMILFTLVLMIFYANYSNNSSIKRCDPLPELLHYQETIREQCPDNENKKLEIKLHHRTALNNYFKQPICDNLLKKMTKGKWVANATVDHKLAKELNEIYENFRKKAGISIQPWREDKRCGYNVLAPKVSSCWPQTGSFCNPQSLTPCCTDTNQGMCVAVTEDQRCDCPTCINTQKYKDALTAHWVAHDESCSWRNYTSLEACAVLNKLSSPSRIARLYFVGDSLMRNMFMGFTSLLTGELKKGIRKKCISKELESQCWGENLFIMRHCHDLSVAFSLEDIAHNDGVLCNGYRVFEAEYVGIGMPSQAGEFIEFLTKLKGEENVYVIFGVGLHFHTKVEDVVNQFIQPAITSLEHTEDTWPRLIWAHPNSVGLLKPPAYMSTQGDAPIGEFAKNMDIYLQQHNIPVLDFREITKGVNSYDGTHYGSGVNIMKAQILLNHLASVVV